MNVRVFGQEDPDQSAIDDISFQIVCFTQGKWRSLVFLQKVLGVLREHPELCQNPNYQRLYDECIYFLLLEIKLCKTWTTYGLEEQKRYLEKLIDTENQSKASQKLTLYDVEAYLEYRCRQWAKNKETPQVK